MLDRLRRFLTINSAVSEALTIFSKSAKKKTLFLFLGKVHNYYNLAKMEWNSTKRRAETRLEIRLGSYWESE